MGPEKMTARGMKTMQADLPFLMNFRDMIRTAIMWFEHRYIEM
jgi:hypothetical protein